MKLDQNTPRSLSHSVDVYLDGVKVEDCVEAYVGFGDNETEGLGYIIEPVTDSVSKHGVSSLSIDTTKARDAFDYDGLWCTIRMGYVKIDVDEDSRKRLEQYDPKFLQTVTPLPMILHCPRCSGQHIDKEESENEYNTRVGVYGLIKDPDRKLRWLNPPHKSHLCAGCGLIWRPAEVPTTGVERILPGKNDNWRGHVV